MLLYITYEKHFHVTTTNNSTNLMSIHDSMHHHEPFLQDPFLMVLFALHRRSLVALSLIICIIRFFRKLKLRLPDVEILMNP